MTRLHIVQGGIQNGDMQFLERAAEHGIEAKVWTIPKKSQVGDEVAIFIQGIGLFATAKVNTPPRKRPNWTNRYGGGLTGIRLIKTPIPLGEIKRRLDRWQGED